ELLAFDLMAIVRFCSSSRIKRNSSTISLAISSFILNSLIFYIARGDNSSSGAPRLLTQCISMTKVTFLCLAIERIIGLHRVSCNLISRVYMGLIDPFRKWIIYPAMLKTIHATWDQNI